MGVEMTVSAIDIERELRNWAAFVTYGDDGAPIPPTVCGSVEKEYADHLSRFQWESRPPRPFEPRIHDGYLMERLICDPEFPAIWRKVLQVQYLRWPEAAGVWTADQTYEDKLQVRARAAGVSFRSYPMYLDGAKRELERLILGGRTATVKLVDDGRVVFGTATT